VWLGKESGTGRVVVDGGLADLLLQPRECRVGRDVGVDDPTRADLHDDEDMDDPEESLSQARRPVRRWTANCWRRAAFSRAGVARDGRAARRHAIRAMTHVRMARDGSTRREVVLLTGVPPRCAGPYGLLADHGSCRPPSGPADSRTMKNEIDVFDFHCMVSPW